MAHLLILLIWFYCFLQDRSFNFNDIQFINYLFHESSLLVLPCLFYSLHLIILLTYLKIWFSHCVSALSFSWQIFLLLVYLIAFSTFANILHISQFSRSVMSDSLQTPWTAARQASLSITNAWSLLKLMSIKSVMPSNHLILCHPFSRLQSFPASESFPMSQLFASDGQNTGVSASASVLPVNIQDWFPLGLTGCIFI